MKDFMLHTAKTSVAVSIESDHIWVSNGEMNSNNESYNLSFDHYQKLKSYKSVSALLKYAKANQLDTPSHPSHDLPSDDSLGGVSPSSSVELHPSNDALTDDSHSPVQSPIINSDVAFENGSLAGESSPVAASSYPATSDTPLKSTTGEKSCDRAACPFGGANKVNVESNHDTANNNRPFFELPKLKTKPSCLAVLS